MRRGELYRVRHPGGDPKRSRVFVVVSRQALLDSRFSAAICAPVFTRGHGLSTQVTVGIQEGLKHDSSIHCDGLVCVPKATLTDYIGRLRAARLDELDSALGIAVGLT